MTTDQRTAFDTRFAELRERLAEIQDLTSIGAVLGWDRSTYLPEGGAAARGRQSAVLSRIRHAKATDADLGRLIDGLERDVEALEADSFEARLVRVARRDFDRATRLPSDFVARMSRHTSETYGAWTKARPANDFAAMVPRLEQTLELSRQYSAFFPEFSHPMDVFVDGSDEGMTVQKVRAVFAELREGLVPLVRAVTERPEPRTDFVGRAYDVATQLRFGESVARDYGYDFSRGRQDLTAHPFMTRFSIDDVRITTRVQENDLTDALFSTLHETGHALYEQNVDRAFEGLPLARGASAGVHESSSRLWENVVGRSRGFWARYFGPLRDTFPQQLADVSEEEMYRAVNVVRKSLIRTDADELTYNLHVILRFELELAMIEGTLEVRDLADAWHARYESDLGMRAPDDRDGVLQDVHWFGGLIGGAFHGYTLGNILSLQFWDAAVKAHPGIPGEIERGEFGALRGWLTQNVYRFGRSRAAAEVARNATGSELTVAPYLAYLRGKYGELYNLS
ncbi:carboxypeptidase M32 [Deinococcus yavapaiensis]|uniref:Metal-dependent carboxypeptidase n=1 Tax=Deinococcus yavapaiensis KR-236 TaxID=694435 RepID=A0A318S0D3_9DEIO|nr:carboxypeptidase M32 [Deinococcus yavapaiensis]PYE50025.1 carboxypeptidase Taq [Deinococcus yavapaiensis KR-236]